MVESLKISRDVENAMKANGFPEFNDSNARKRK